MNQQQERPKERKTRGQVIAKKASDTYSLIDKEIQAIGNTMKTKMEISHFVTEIMFRLHLAMLISFREKPTEKRKSNGKKKTKRTRRSTN